MSKESGSEEIKDPEHYAESRYGSLTPEKEPCS
jgi:hypothetical protein